MGRVFRGNPVRMPAAIGLAASLLALPTAAAASPTVVTVRKTVAVTGAGPTPATLRCPTKGLALSGYATRLSGGALARDSIPRGVGSWRFNLTSRGRGRADLALRCLRVRVPQGLTRVRTGVSTARGRLVVPARSSRTVRLRCARGHLPTGYGLDRSEAGSAGRNLSLTSAVPAARSWSFRIENAGAATLAGQVRLRCVTERARGTRAGGGSATERFSITRVGFTDRVAGARSLSRRCPSGRASLAAGHYIRASDDVTLPLGFPAGTRSGRWRVRNPGGGPERVHTYLSCLSLRTGFR